MYNAGLDAGDLITSVDGKSITSAAEFTAALAAHKPGERMTVAFTGLAGPKTTTIEVGEDPSLRTLTYEDAGRTPSAEQLAMRTKWLASKAK
jgi:S1-C subfamily serine protease